PESAAILVAKTITGKDEQRPSRRRSKFGIRKAPLPETAKFVGLTPTTAILPEIQTALGYHPPGISLRVPMKASFIRIVELRARLRGQGVLKQAHKVTKLERFSDEVVDSHPVKVASTVSLP